MTINDSISNYKLLHTLLAENMLRKMKLTTVIFVLCNISAMCTDMTKTYDIMIGLRQLLCMCKAEETELNDRVAVGVSVFNELLQTKYKKNRNLKFALFERQLNMLYNQYKQALKYYAGNL